MPTRRRTVISVQAERTLQPLLLREGSKFRAARRRRRWTQAQLAERVRVAQSTVSDLERGRGATLSLELWQQVALVLGLPLDLALGRDPLDEPADVGHLLIQELILGYGRRIGCRRTFELSTKPSNPSLSTDVGLTDDTHRRLLQIECVNVFGNVNASIRSGDRKRAEADAYAVAIGHGLPFTVHQCWVVRATRRNRALLARYPEIFAARFAGSSRAWVDALTRGTPPPAELGLIWCDVHATRIFEWRSRPVRATRPGERRESDP